MKKGLVVAAFSLLSFFTTAKADKSFGIDDYLALRSISEISVSPDGLFVAYTLTSAELKKDETRDVVWIQPTAGGEPLRMTVEDSDSSSPKWSPDGRYLAVLSDRSDETSQVWLLDRRGGDAQQLTEFKQGVDEFEWAPDSKSLLLLAADPSPADLDEEELPKPRPYVVDRLQFKEDYVGYLTRHRSHVHVIDIASREPRQLTSGDYDDSQPAWSPDGSKIVFVSNRTATPDRNRNTDLWVVDVNAKDARPAQLTTADTADASPSWSPDGRTIIYTSTNPDAKLPIYAIPQLTVVDVATGKTAVNPSLRETQVFDPRYAPDGQSILAITEYRGEQNLVQVESESGAVQSLVEGSDIVTEFDIAMDGTVYPLLTRPQLPDEIFVLNQGRTSQLSFVNKDALDGVALATTEKHTYESKDGTSIESFYVFPDGLRKGKKAPAILYIHGGRVNP